MSNNTATQQVQYVSRETFKKFNEYVNQLIAEVNKLEARVAQLENHEQTRQRLENEAMARKTQKQSQKFQGRNAALEAEAETS